MNESLVLKWLWQWVGSPHGWWKMITPTLGDQIRPWEMRSQSRFWSNIKHLAYVFNSSVKFTVGQGTTI
jgi:hypothetical protein